MWQFVYTADLSDKTSIIIDTQFIIYLHITANIIWWLRNITCHAPFRQYNCSWPWWGLVQKLHHTQLLYA